MSYIRRTQQLVEDVADNVDAMRNDELRKVHKYEDVDIGTPLHNEIRRVVENVLWEKAPELKDKMPDEWCKHEDVLTTIFRLEGGLHTVKYTLEVPTDAKIKMPPNTSRWDVPDVTGKHMTPLVKEWATKRLAVDTQRVETTDLFGSIKQQLKDFLYSHASLNTAVKEMPELEMYVPQEYLDKLNEKTVRSKKPTVNDEDKVTVDVEALTRAAVAHRMTSSN